MLIEVTQTMNPIQLVKANCKKIEKYQEIDQEAAIKISRQATWTLLAVNSKLCQRVLAQSTLDRIDADPL